MECLAAFVPESMQQTGMRGALNGTRKEAYSGADREFASADRSIDCQRQERVQSRFDCADPSPSRSARPGQRVHPLQNSVDDSQLVWRRRRRRPGMIAMAVRAMV